MRPQEELDLALDCVERHPPYPGMTVFFAEIRDMIRSLMQLDCLTPEEVEEFESRLTKREADCERILEEEREEEAIPHISYSKTQL